MPTIARLTIAALLLSGCGGVVTLNGDAGSDAGPDCGAALPVGAECARDCECCSGACVPWNDGGTCGGPCREKDAGP